LQKEESQLVSRSHTYALELNGLWQGAFESEPYETAWGHEAIVFIRSLQSQNLPPGAKAKIQISPDGIHWCDEGSAIDLPPTDGMTFCRLSHFGGWLRLKGGLPAGASLKVIAYIAMKE
jgi:hypothetical protein